MSPALFVLCMEVLSQAITTRVSVGAWKGIQLSASGPTLSHLCFANNLVLFSEASTDQVDVIRDCLDRFCEVSGQRFNISKSRVYFSKNVDTTTAAEIANRLNLTITNDLGTYLRVKSAHGPLKGNHFTASLISSYDFTSSDHIFGLYFLQPSSTPISSSFIFLTP
nr:Retrovirus-related Pol polyprotein LINE-1 [Ipomoea batatas]